MSIDYEYKLVSASSLEDLENLIQRYTGAPNRRVKAMGVISEDKCWALLESQGVVEEET